MKQHPELKPNIERWIIDLLGKTPINGMQLAMIYRDHIKSGTCVFCQEGINEAVKYFRQRFEKELSGVKE